MNADTEAAKEAVRLVRKMFEDATGGGGPCCLYVWWLVTALRGPDTEDNKAKETFTFPIRNACIPRAVEFSLSGKHLSTKEAFSRLAELARKEGSHFHSHSLYALEVLACASRRKAVRRKKRPKRKGRQ